jgi:hypothetical protein
MNRTLKCAAGVVVLSLVVVLCVQLAPQAAQPPGDEAAAEAKRDQESGRADLPLKEYMRKKLEASNKILEGLCVEDPKLVREGAEVLNTMSNSERWRVSNDPLYRQFSSEFQRISQQLKEAAEQENMDQAALRWMDATMSCIECHDFARTMLIAQPAAP